MKLVSAVLAAIGSIIPDAASHNRPLGGHQPKHRNAGTRSERRYVHEVVDVTSKEPDHMGLAPDRFGLMSARVFPVFRVATATSTTFASDLLLTKVI